MLIRAEEQADRAGVRAVNLSAFETALVRAGLEECKRIGVGAVVVLGHPGYYPRFGFSSSARFGIGCEYDVPEGVFMVLELRAAVLRGASGRIRYHPAFRSV